MVGREEAARILADGLEKVPLDGRRVLVLTPDGTRSGPTALMFHLLCDLLLPRVRKLDFLIALGTHMPLSEEAINRLYGLSSADRAGRYAKVNIWNHLWKKPDTFHRIGIIPAYEVEELSQGWLSEALPVALNRIIFDYDHLFIYSPVFPHEVAGFSGGHKYLFPGIAGPEIVNLTHWLGALLTTTEIIGRAETPVRALIERAAQMVDIPRTGVAAVVEEEDSLAALFVGPVEESWRQAVKLSAQRHIRWVDRPYQLVISVMPEMYDDLWVGAKGMYKMEPVVADGGELIIFAPHIREVSFAHGRIIDEIGYHVRDYFVKQWDRFRHYPGGVLAHSTHVKGRGEYDGGVERPRIRVTLATGIPRERCEHICLGWRDPDSLKLTEYTGREEEGILVVPRAGEIFYRLRS